MIWEEMYRTDGSCRCGRGKITSIHEMDDFNNVRDKEIIICDICNPPIVNNILGVGPCLQT